MIVFDRVSRRHADGREALSGASLRIDTGELVFITGVRGAGKSTAIKLMALQERPSQGTVTVNGQNLGALSRRRIPAYRRTLGIIPQTPCLMPDDSVFENVALPLRVAGVRGQDLARRVRDALDEIGLREREHQPVRALSVGEQQCVTIARAIVNRPSVLLADEPLNHLDTDLTQRVMRIFKHLQESGSTVVIALGDPAPQDSASRESATDTSTHPMRADIRTSTSVTESATHSLDYLLRAAILHDAAEPATDSPDYRDGADTPDSIRDPGEHASDYFNPATLFPAMPNPAPADPEESALPRDQASSDSDVIRAQTAAGSGIVPPQVFTDFDAGRSPSPAVHPPLLSPALKTRRIILANGRVIDSDRAHGSDPMTAHAHGHEPGNAPALPSMVADR
jgi:cell division transport system ATP-binding protein